MSELNPNEPNKTQIQQTIDEKPSLDNNTEQKQIAEPEKSAVSQEKRNHNVAKKQAKNTDSNKYLISILLAILLIVVILSISIYQTFFTRIEQPNQRLEIEKGQSYYSVLDKWQSSAPLFSKTLAKLYIKTKINSPLYMGAYELPKNPNLYETLSILQQGANVTLVKIQVLEGKTNKDLYKKLLNTEDIKIKVLNLPKEKLIAELGIPLTDLPNAIIEPNNMAKIKPKIEQEKSETKADKNIKTSETLANKPAKKTDTDYFNYNLEGWFAPNTYFYTQGSTDKDILSDLYRRQKAILTKEWNNRAEGLPYKTPYEALIMASIIEKETGLVEERPLIAGVFLNRLKHNMRLQTDPTIIYGMGERYDGNIRKKDIAEKTPYNTYQINGLPPTPIASPSEGAIHSALHPAKTDALFFVATGDGGHKFSKTYVEHQQAVAEYLKVIKEKEGKE